jgi:hypothetical protein
LRAFASTNGDYNRTATIVGMSAAEVRAEIASLLNGRPEPTAASSTNGHAPRETAPAAAKVSRPAKAATPAAAKPKAKKR